LRQERRLNGTQKKTALRKTERKAQEKVGSGKKTQILILIIDYLIKIIMKDILSVKDFGGDI